MGDREIEQKVTKETKAEGDEELSRGGTAWRRIADLESEPKAAKEGGRQPLRIRNVNEAKEDYAWFTLITLNSAPPANAERGVRSVEAPNR